MNNVYDFRTDALLKMVMFWGEWTTQNSFKWTGEKFVRYSYNANLTGEGKPKFHADARKNDTGDFDRALCYLETQYEKYAPTLLPHYTIIADNGYCGKGTGSIYKIYDTKPPRPEVDDINFLLKCVCYTQDNKPKNFYSRTGESELTDAMMSIVAQVAKFQTLSPKKLQPIGYLYGGEKLYKFGEKIPAYPAFLCTSSRKIYYNGTRRPTKLFQEASRRADVVALENLLSDLKSQMMFSQ